MEKAEARFIQWLKREASWGKCIFDSFVKILYNGSDENMAEQESYFPNEVILFKQFINNTAKYKNLLMKHNIKFIPKNVAEINDELKLMRVK